MRAYAAVGREEFLGVVRQCAELNLFRMRQCYDAETGCGCLVGLGSVIAGRMLGDERLESEHPTVEVPFAEALEKWIGVPMDLSQILSTLFEMSPDDEHAQELAVLTFEYIEAGSDLTGCAERFRGLAGNRWWGGPWDQKGNLMLRILQEAGGR